jgi:hypothetical protein
MAATNSAKETSPPVSTKDLSFQIDCDMHDSAASRRASGGEPWSLAAFSVPMQFGLDLRQNLARKDRAGMVRRRFPAGLKDNGRLLCASSIAFQEKSCCEAGMLTQFLSRCVLKLRHLSRRDLEPRQRP